METRASHVLVGGFVLLFIAGLIGFAIWLAKVDLDREYTDYDIYFDGTVSGLYKRGTVYYLGIPVGEVRDITLAPNDPRKVRVWVRLDGDVPVNEGATARLEFQGLTGVAYVEIKGGDPDRPVIEAVDGAPRPVIPSEASAFQELFESAPNLINEAIMTVVRLQMLLSDENLASVRDTLANLNKVSGNVATASENIEGLLVDTRATLQAAAVAAENLGKLADSGNALLESDGKRMVDEAVATMEAARGMLARIDGLVAANEGTVTQFVGSTLPEVSRMVMDLRRASRNLSRLIGRIEQRPGDALFGPGPEQYDMKNRPKQEGDDQ
ncbi:MlaD family protein [Pseudokordiimonas caeni]|uniref:MlaD family protein n=1 Tax=Pseudokordiimonas caeni TaxID=2997908 RepID=UPI002810CA17|nr:MlaD family protein [Pseudokordiimonas caeni]